MQTDPLVQTEHNDSVSLVTDTINILNAYQEIDSAVSEIQKNTERGLYEKKEMDRMSAYGGYVFELIDSNDNMVYFFSHRGGELGSTELECFYKNQVLVFIIQRKFEHINMESDNKKLVFEVINYVTDSTITKRNLVKSQENYVWKESDPPSTEDILSKVHHIESDIEEWIE